MIAPIFHIQAETCIEFSAERRVGHRQAIVLQRSDSHTFSPRFDRSQDHFLINAN
jgi:hypothetical protein